jgi:hypothetical protein
MMSKVKERLSIACPLAQAETRLKQYFAAHGSSEGDVARLPLTLPLGLMSNASIERMVTATFHRLERSGEMDPHYHIEWAPEEPGPFPLFAGDIVIGDADDYDAFSIEIRGEYKPPLAMLGAGFDMVLGNRIAHETIRTLLHDMKRFIETQYQEDEARKVTPG